MSNNNGGCNSPNDGDIPSWPLRPPTNMNRSSSASSLRRVQSLPTLASFQRSGEDNTSSSGLSNGVIRRSTSLVDLIEEALSVVGDDFEGDFADNDFDFLDINADDDDEDEHRASFAARVRARRDAANGSRGRNTGRGGNAGPNSSSQ